MSKEPLSEDTTFKLFDRPDIRAMRHFIAGDISSSAWNITILPLIDNYVRSWCKDDEWNERRCRNKLWLAVDEELTRKHHEAIVKEETSQWIVGDDGEHAVRRFQMWEAYVIAWKDEFWLSVYSHPGSRVVHTTCETLKAGMDFANTLFAGMNFDGQCFDGKHTKRRERDA